MDNQNIAELVISLIGVIALVFGIAQRRQRSFLIQNGVKTVGTVMDIKGLHTSAGQPANSGYTITVQYVTDKNETITKEYYLSTLKKYKPGDDIEVTYDPRDNKEFIIDNKITRYAGPVGILIGVALIAYAVVCYVFKIPIHFQQK